jgi:hypothetical protein
MIARSDTICGGSAQAGEITDTFALSVFLEKPRFHKDIETNPIF